MGQSQVCVRSSEKYAEDTRTHFRRLVRKRDIMTSINYRAILWSKICGSFPILRNLIWNYNNQHLYDDEFSMTSLYPNL